MSEWDYPKHRERPTRYMHHEVVLLNKEQYGDGFPADHNARDFIKWLEGVIDQAPPEYRDMVFIEIDSTTSYDQSLATVKVAYRRPETDEELAARQAEFERVRAAKEAHDRAEFARLKAKFGPTT